MIVIDGKGLNGEKADAIELYTRAAKILGKIKAETFQVTTGANVIDAKSGTVAAIEGSGLKPLKLIMNNGAVLYQEIGALQPFNWTASISGHVNGGNK